MIDAAAFAVTANLLAVVADPAGATARHAELVEAHRARRRRRIRLRRQAAGMPNSAKPLCAPTSRIGGRRRGAARADRPRPGKGCRPD